MGILVELFDVDYDIFIQAQVLLFGIFYVSSLLRGVLPKTGDDGPFAEVLIKYVMTGLVISAFAIIYVYILKILIFPGYAVQFDLPYSDRAVYCGTSHMDHECLLYPA